jgi:uncharacterized protein (DUF4415 family)
MDYCYGVVANGEHGSGELLRRIGQPITIRISDDALDIARAQAKKMKKPLRALLREMLEKVLRGEYLS